MSDAQLSAEVNEQMLRVADHVSKIETLTGLQRKVAFSFLSLEFSMIMLSLGSAARTRMPEGIKLRLIATANMIVDKYLELLQSSSDLKARVTVADNLKVVISKWKGSPSVRERTPEIETAVSLVAKNTDNAVKLRRAAIGVLEEMGAADSLAAVPKIPWWKRW